MISDIIFDALEAIERYQVDSPNLYDRYAMEINHCKKAMRELLTQLDDPHPETKQ